jgi:PPM family protein phosphatase
MLKDGMKIRGGAEAAGMTDVGCQRDNNEDHFAYWEPDTDLQFEEKGRLAVVADGMGGYEGGQEASSLAVNTVIDVYSKASDSNPQAVLLSALKAAHERIREKAAATPTLYGMGTTCTAAVIVSGHLYFAHVGDSRLYLLRAGALTQLTRDHSYVGRLVESGLISRDEAEFHPQRHILTAALGTVGELVTDSRDTPLLLEPGDTLVLCTDGLWGQVRDEELARIAHNAAPVEICNELIQLARQRGGPDNITLQVIRIGPLA